MGSMSMITVIYYVIVLVLSMMQRYRDIDRRMAYSAAFTRVGMRWAQYVVAFGVLKGLHVVFI
jgi:hypothetical protein